MKKKVVVFIIVVFILFCVTIKDEANAHHGAGGFWPAICLGGIIGCAAAQVIRPSVVEPPPPPPPPVCFRDFPGHCVTRWNPSTYSYEQVCFPPYRESFPCR